MVPPVRMMSTRVLDAASLGVLAWEALSRPGPAAVLAGFERSFCLDVGGTLITIGGEELHDGPLNLRLMGHRGAGFSTDLWIEIGQRWAISSDRLDRRDGLSIDLANAGIWRPKRPVARPDASRVVDGLACLRHLLGGMEFCDDGLLGVTLQPGSARTPTERAAQPHIKALKADLPRWLRGDTDGDPDPAIRLLGLGPGLTPSGDDLLAGILVAWHHLDASEAANRLGSSLLRASAARTTPISFAHLDAATQGYGAAPLHHLLDALIVGRRAEIAEALDVAAKIGHSSGLDAIAGMVLALSAWLLADDEAPVTA